MNPVPVDPTTQIELGNALAARGLLVDAEMVYRQTLQVAPSNANLLNNLGNVLAAQRRTNEAIAMYRRALAVDPGLVIAHSNLANALREIGENDQAIACLRRAIQLKPDFAGAYNNLGTLLKDQGQIEQGIEAMRQSVALDPATMEMRSNLVYAVLFHPDYTPPQQLAEARAWADRFEQPRIVHRRPHGNDPTPDRKIRIGYVSPDFRDHVVGRNVLPIIERHDRSQFEVHCFMTTITVDFMTERFRNVADCWHSVASLNETDLAELIRNERIDILVDLSLHMAGNRLAVFARKPAPVQVTWAGYPGTTGLAAIDYRITDPYLDPPGHGDEFYSEKSIRLPHSFWCYRPVDGAAEVNALPAMSNGFVNFGCFNNMAKITSASLDLWADVLLAVPDSKLSLLTPLGQVMDHLRARFAIKGIEVERLIFVQRTSPVEYLKLYHQIDICLDPLPYTGHSTTLDALWMGAVLITLKGRTVASRGTASPLSNLDLTELIASTPEQYVQIAARLAGDVEGLAKLRSQLRQRMRTSPICDERRFTTDLEIAYRRMWKSWCESP